MFVCAMCTPRCNLEKMNWRKHKYVDKVRMKKIHELLFMKCMCRCTAPYLFWELGPGETTKLLFSDNFYFIKCS